MYFRANASVVTTGWDEIRLYFNSDNDPETGTNMGCKFNSNTGANGIDNMINCEYASGGTPANPIGRWNGASVYQASTGTWFAAITGTEAITGGINVVNCVHGIGAVNGDYYELEIQVKLATLPWTLQSPFTLASMFGEADNVNYMAPYEWDWQVE